MSDETPDDGFCPTCKALDDEACHRPDGSARPDHKRRHPYPALAVSCNEKLADSRNSEHHA